MMILLKLLFDRRWKSPKEDDLILQRPGIAKMIHQMILVISLLLMVSVLFNNISIQQCGIDTYSVYQMMQFCLIFSVLSADVTAFCIIHSTQTEVTPCSNWANNY